MRSPPKPQRDLCVRFVRTEPFAEPALASRAAAMLGVEEQRTIARLRPANARCDYLAAHALARTMLAERLGWAPERLRFRYSPRGRPELAIPLPSGAPRLRFSLSHADGIALCAVAMDCAVGADVESLRNVGPDPLDVAAMVCCPRELAALRAAAPADQAEAFLLLWARKEAVAKASGLGLHAAQRSRTARWGRWRLTTWRPTASHLVAVAVPRGVAGDGQIRLEEAVLE